jgi:hypothetical protein
VIPVGGPQQDFIDLNDLTVPPRASQYLDLCENKPEVFTRLRFFSPFKEETFIDPWFFRFVQESQISAPEYEYYHSSVNLESCQKGIAKYCRKIDYHIHQSSLDLAYEWTKRTYYPFVQNSRVISMLEAVSSAELSTSPGPLMRKVYKDKKDVWEDIHGRHFILVYFSQAQSPGGPITYWGLFQKVELRPIEKVNENKTRQFMCAPIEHHIALQMLSQDFNIKIMNAAKMHRIPISVGMSIYDGNFDIIGRNLEQCSEQLFSDVSSFDASTPHIMSLMCAAFRYDCLSSEDRTFENLCLFANLYRDVIYTPLVLPDGNVVKIGGTPSGYFNTAMDNSFILDMSIAYCWISSGKGKSYSDYNNYVYRKVYGDDSVIGIRSPGLNFATALSERMQDLGYQIDQSPFWEFLGHYIVYNYELHSYVPVFMHSRVFAALCYSGEPDFFKCASKAMSIRIDSYTNKKAFSLVDDYCRWLIKNSGNYRDDLASQYISESEIRLILIGRSHGGKHCKSPFKVRFASFRMSTQTVVTKTVNNNNKKKNKRKNGKNPKPATTVVSKTTVTPAPIATGKFIQSGSNRSSNSNAPAKDYHNYLPRAVSGKYSSLINEILDPDCEFVTRMPNPVATPVALQKSIREFVISIDASSPSFNGRVAFAVNPHFGSAQQPASYKVALCKPGFNSSTDFSSASAYETVLSNAPGMGGQQIDLRYDPYFQKFTQPGLSGLRADSGAGALNSPPFGTNPTVNDPFSYGLTIRFSATPLVGNGTRVLFPPGQWHVSVSGIFTPANIGNVTILGGPGVNVTLSQSTLGNNALGTQTIYSDDWVITTADSAQGGFVDIFTPAGATPQAGTVDILPTFLPELTNPFGAPIVPPMNYGDVAEYRPIAMSVLSTCMLPALTNGGFIAANRTNGRLTQQSFFSSNTNQAIGDFHFWEQIDTQETSYSGPISGGAYTFWMPDTQDDKNILTPSAALANSYPTIIHAAVWTPTNTVGLGVTAVLRVRIVTIYELVSGSPFYPMKQPDLIDNEDLQAVLYFLNSVQGSMPNGEHLKNIKKYLAKGAEIVGKGMKWFLDNKERIMAGMNTAATIAPMLM